MSLYWSSFESNSKWHWEGRTGRLFICNEHIHRPTESLKMIWDVKNITPLSTAHTLIITLNHNQSNLETKVHSATHTHIRPHDNTSFIQKLLKWKCTASSLSVQVLFKIVYLLIAVMQGGAHQVYANSWCTSTRGDGGGGARCSNDTDTNIVYSSTREN